VPATGLVHTLIERLAARFSAGPHASEITAAREEYFNQAGRVFEDDGELFEQRTTAFLEWYVCERPLSGGTSSPALLVLEREGARLADDERRAVAALASSHRSLFQVTAVDDGTVDLRDLIGGGRFSVRERRSTAGFRAGDLVEARVFWSGSDVVFGKTFLFHPPEAGKAIAGIIAAALARGEGRGELLFHLARLHLRWFRQGHLAAERIYEISGA
jgi:hypothetical protein